MPAMIMTVEISMYPLNADYRPLIEDFIKQLNTYQDLRCTTTPTATMVIGEYTHVMQALTELFRWSHQTHGRAVFITKFIPDYDPQ